MNRWDCDITNCGRYVVGVGGAIGLRLIGWHVAFDARSGQGPWIACPLHHPDGIEVADRAATDAQQALYTPADVARLGNG